MKKSNITLGHKSSNTLERAILARLREISSTHSNGWKIVERDSELKNLLSLLQEIGDGEKSDLSAIRLKIESLLSIEKRTL